MKYQDELRIMSERETFTQEDLQADLQCSSAWTSRFFAALVRSKYIERIRVGSYWLYAITPRGKRAVASFPALDTEERCLLLWYCGHSETVSRAWIASGDIINTQEICTDCGEVVAWTERQNSYAGWVGSDGTVRNKLK